MIGRTLAHYKILEKMGSGGMGVVYRAEDTKLGRHVALKVLPVAFLEDEERRARFGREARILASLNHPNIAALYSLEQEDGVDFLVLELVEGETLAERIARGPLRLEEALALFRQIAEALEAAHGKGVVHRDLKPSNIKIAPGGKVKVLDFGLAKASMPDPSSGDPSQSPTVSRHVTESGVILGTAAYMSPEQARGDGVDKRTDIWAFGCCLLEALSGKPPFLGRTVSDTIAKILETEPDWARLPAGLRTLLKRCLRKDPGRRIHDIADVRIELEEIGDSDTPVALRRRWLPYVVTALIASAVTAFGIWNVKRTESPGAERALQVTSAIGVESYPTWSPAGGRVAYESNQTGNWDIWVTQLGGGEPVNLTGDPSGADRFPSWSPDAQQIAYLSEKDRIWNLYTLSALGGRPRKLLSLLSTVYSPPWGSPQWSQDGSELAVAFRDSGRNFVEIVSLESRESRRIPLPGHDEDAPHDLSWSPDGRYFAYVTALQFNAEITRLWILPSSGGEAVPVTDGYTNVWHPSWSSDGRRLYFVSNLGGRMDLWYRRIGERGMPRDEPERVTTGLEVRTAAFSPDGTRLAYSRGRREFDSNIWRVRILHDRLATWADAEQLTFDNAFIQFFDVSPDGKRLVFSSDRPETRISGSSRAKGARWPSSRRTPLRIGTRGGLPTESKLLSTPIGPATARSGSCPRKAGPLDSSPSTRLSTSIPRGHPTDRRSLSHRGAAATLTSGLWMPRTASHSSSRRIPRTSKLPSGRKTAGGSGSGRRPGAFWDYRRHSTVSPESLRRDRHRAAAGLPTESSSTTREIARKTATCGPPLWNRGRNTASRIFSGGAAD